ncbi:stage II sporulation protein M [[Eubacterium] hominis]|uniref:stage II sporulation protein M n=1 Tax=[Eubacterium] hominis TaxID=2764325 RepID=UPI003A4D9096
MKQRIYHGFFRKYRNVYLFIAILLVAGFAAGLYFSKTIDINDMKNFTSYLNSMSDNATSFSGQFLSGILFILFVFFLGTSIIGIPFISFIVFTKGMQIGFSCALFVYTYQLKGIAGIILTLFPQVLVDCLATFLISASAIQLSMYLIISCSNKERLDFRKLADSILNDLIICFLIVIVEAYIKADLMIQLVNLFNLIGK